MIMGNQGLPSPNFLAFHQARARAAWDMNYVHLNYLRQMSLYPRYPQVYLPLQASSRLQQEANQVRISSSKNVSYGWISIALFSLGFLGIGCMLSKIGSKAPLLQTPPVTMNQPAQSPQRWFEMFFSVVSFIPALRGRRINGHFRGFPPRTQILQSLSQGFTRESIREYFKDSFRGFVFDSIREFIAETVLSFIWEVLEEFFCARPYSVGTTMRWQKGFFYDFKMIPGLHSSNELWMLFFGRRKNLSVMFQVGQLFLCIYKIYWVR